MKWKTFKEEPPCDTPLLVFYNNGKLDKGYMVCSKSEGDVWLFPRDREYVMKKWSAIDEVE